MLPRLRLALLLLTPVTLAAAGPALAEPDLRWRGSLLGDIRFFTDDELTFERVETTANARLSARLDKHVAAVADLSVIFTEAPTPQAFSDLGLRERLDPWRFESDALYVDFFDLGVDGLDLRIGRQQLIWGSADRFHPVSNLNPLDLEDPTRFGRVIANEMVTLALRPDWALGEDDEGGPWLAEVALQLVFVPFFKPARLPRSAELAFVDEDVFRERANTPLTRDLVAKQDVLERDAGWTFTNVPRVVLPERTPANSMLGARLSGRLLGVDMGLTYFRGFDDIPRAEKIVADTSAIPHVETDVVLTYPRVQVLGFDAATSLGFLDGMGFWTEIGVTFHDDLRRVISTGPAIGIDAVEREHAAGAFVKAVVGADYTPVPWLYLNVQYLHGFVDEFTAGDLGNYLVAGGDLKFAHDSVLLRFFNIFDLDDGSYVLFPQLVVKPWVGGELALGGFIYSSSFSGYDETRKFDSRASGRSSVFLQARATL